MPVRMRLATKGAARKASIAESMSSSVCGGADLLEGANQEIDVVVEQLEVVRHFFDSAHRRRHHQHLGSRLPADGGRRLQIEVRLNEYQLHVLSLHLVDQI